jgi:hypothetical protein
MTFEECGNSEQGHVTEDDDDHTCQRCDADRCPVCLQWFRDYDTFIDHVEAGE